MVRGVITDKDLEQASARVKAHLINSLAAEFYARRLELDLREEDVAQSIGSSQSRISSIERAEGNPTLDTVARLAAALGMEIEVSLRPARVRKSMVAAVAQRKVGRPRRSRPTATTIRVPIRVAASGR
jgi:transcriptional regulator with XRE-family HTH domain